MLYRHTGRRERLLDNGRILPYEDDGARVFTNDPNQRRKVLALAQSTGNQHRLGIHTVQRSHCRAYIRTFAIVHEIHAAYGSHKLSAMRFAAVITQDRKSDV